MSEENVKEANGDIGTAGDQLVEVEQNGSSCSVEGSSCNVEGSRNNVEGSRNNVEGSRHNVEGSRFHANDPESDEEGSEVDKICKIVRNCKNTPTFNKSESCEKRMLTPSPTTDCMRRYPCKSAKVYHGDESKEEGIHFHQDRCEDKEVDEGVGTSHKNECTVFHQVLQAISSEGAGQDKDEEKFVPISVPGASQDISKHSNDLASTSCSDNCVISRIDKSCSQPKIPIDLISVTNSSPTPRDGPSHCISSHEDASNVCDDEIDPPHINHLPSLLMSQILSYLTMKELLCTASLVCKAWYQAAREPTLWKRLILDKPTIGDEDLWNLVSINPYLSHLHIADCRKVTGEGVVKALAACSALKELILMRCSQLKADAFLQIGEYCPLLTKVNFSNSNGVSDEALEKIAANCPNLTELRLNRCAHISDSSIQEIARRCPKLRILSFQENQRITDAALSVLCRHSVNMEVLSLHKCAITNNGVMDIHKLSRIQNLDLSNLASLRSDSVSEVVRNLPNLHTLNLCLSKNISDSCLHTIAASCKKLKYLFLVSCSITDEGLISIGRHNRSIEHMDVGWCQDITDRGATALSQTCPQLNYLGLVRCDKITEECMSRLVTEFPNIHYSTFLLDSKRLFEKARQQGYSV